MSERERKREKEMEMEEIADTVPVDYEEGD